MKLIVGLGNPGLKYAKTRHNAGFRILDDFADLARVMSFQTKFDGLLASFVFHEETIFLFKPQTFMNLSGTAVRKIVDFYKIPLTEILIIYDDMALEPGHIRLRPGGSSGGHKGMQNIIDELKTEDLKRIRIGIGEPPYDPIEHVLGTPKGDEAHLITAAEEHAVQAIKEYLVHGFPVAMNSMNGGNGTG